MTEPSETISTHHPPDWRDWLEEWPSVKSIAFFVFLAWPITALLMWLVGGLSYFPTHAPQDKGELILKLLDRWLDALNWLTAAAVFGVVGKFATTKPEVIRAEGEVKARAVVAQAVAAQTAEYPVPAAARTSPATAPPGTDPAVAAAIGGGVEGALLEAEAQRRREKHELSPPIVEEVG